MRNDYLYLTFNKMKKLVVLMMTMAILVASAPLTMATDICSNDPLSNADFYVKTNSAVYLRDISCMDSNVIATLPAGELLHVIGKTEDWHKVVRRDGSQGWLWVSFLDQTSESFDIVPMYDVSGHKYEDAIMYIYDNGIVGGYPDGSYQPDRTINRAELLKIVVEANYGEEDFGVYSDDECFNDVPANTWFTPYVCFAKHQGIVEGYPDGTFKPGQEVNFVEALKITTVGFGHEYSEGDPWYKDTVDYASSVNAIPLDITAFGQSFTRGQMADMITRILKYQNSQATLDEYLGDAAVYKVTYNTIQAALNVEDVVGTGQCISTDAELYDDGSSMELSECTTCACDNGNWLCTGLCM